MVVRDKQAMEKQRILIIEELWEVRRILILGSKQVRFSQEALLLVCFLNYGFIDKGFHDFTHRFDEKMYIRPIQIQPIWIFQWGRPFLLALEEK